MNVHVSYKTGKTSAVEHEFHHQIQKLQRRLRVFKPDLIHLHAFVEQKNSYRAGASLNLRLPSGQMAAQRSGENPVAAVKASFADLLSQVTKHKELLRGQWTGKSGTRGSKKSPGPAVRPAQTFAAAASAKEVSKRQTDDDMVKSGLKSWVTANLSRLQEFVDGELHSRIAAGQVREEQISREEVIDEVMVSALSQQEDARAERLSLESWFHQLALQAILRLITSNADTANISLDARVGKQNVTGSDENLLQYHQPDDTLQEENVIRDATVSTPEEIVASEEMVAQLDIVLHGINTRDREAFVLYTLEGFTVEEISRLASRTPERVRKSIQRAREHIQQKLPELNQFRQSLLRHSRVA